MEQRSLCEHIIKTFHTSWKIIHKITCRKKHLNEVVLFVTNISKFMFDNGNEKYHMYLKQFGIGNRRGSFFYIKR